MSDLNTKTMGFFKKVPESPTNPQDTKTNTKFQIDDLYSSDASESETGGSVALELGRYIQNEDNLRLWKAELGKKIRFENYAVPSGKQPQQFFSLALLRTAPDVIINLAGHNELFYTNRLMVPASYPSPAHFFFTGPRIKKRVNDMARLIHQLKK